MTTTGLKPWSSACPYSQKPMTTSAALTFVLTFTFFTSLRVTV